MLPDDVVVPSETVLPTIQETWDGTQLFGYRPFFE